MSRSALVSISFSFLWLVGLHAQQETEPGQTYASPDGRFALQLSAADDQSDQAKIEIVEKASGKVVGDLGTDYASLGSHMKVVWSADSKRVAYRSGGTKDWHTSVAFWNGSAFEPVELPENLPLPTMQFRKEDEGGGVKNYGGGEEPLRWLKSGDLQLLGEHMELARESGRTYTATITITIGFDAQHHALVRSASKSKTKVDD